MAKQVGDGIADCLKRRPAERVSMQQKNYLTPRSKGGNGKFAGLPGGPSGGSMGAAGKKRPYSSSKGID